MWSVPGVRVLVSDFLAFSRGRVLPSLALIAAGAALEGVGIVMLVPIVSLILEQNGQGSLAAPVFALLGLETAGARMIVALVAFLVVILLRFAVILFRDDLLVGLQQDFVADLRARAFRSLSRKPWAEVARLRHGPVGHALIRDADRASACASNLISGALAAVTLVIQLGIAVALAPAVTLIVGLIGVALYSALRRFRERAERYGAVLTEEDLTMFETVGAFLDGLKPTKAHGLEQGYLDSFRAAAGRLAAIRRAFAWDMSLSRLILQTAAGGVAIMAILLGLFVLDTPPGNLVVTLIVLARLYGPVQILQVTAQALRHAAPGYRAIREIAGPVARAAPGPAVPVSAPAGLDAPPRIDLVEVAWRGETLNGTAAGLPVLHGISAAIPAGKVTAVLGDSGAGKSTLCDIATLLLAPDSGEVRINGAVPDEALVRRLRAALAYVGQEPFLFDDSLRGNLCWGAGQVDDAEIWRALETVGAADLARGLEGGLDGRLRVQGGRFSGGERQRLRLARALLRRPRLLVLDEATNALDLEAESSVLRAVLAARRGATVIMVSHRPGNIRLADHAIVLDRGRLAETGPVGKLLEDPESRLSQLVGRVAPASVQDGGTNVAP